MIFSYFSSVKAANGRVCTADTFWLHCESENVKSLCAQIAKETDKDKIGELKKGLPIVTWQAYFAGKRLIKEAVPSGLFMLDIDHVENPYELYKTKVAGKTQALGIMLVHMTPSTHGLRVVAKCRPEFFTLAECQKWLAEQLELPQFDEVCKDFARSSFLVPTNYIYYVDGHIFTDDPPVKYSIDNDWMEKQDKLDKAIDKANKEIDQREGLFGGQEEYRGIPLTQLANEWFEETGGMPEQGERNARFYKLALRMRYLTDFNEATMLRVMPDLGLPEDERKQCIHSAITTTRAADMPKDMRDIIDMQLRIKELGGKEDDGVAEVLTDTTVLPPMPPVIRQFVDCAPDDFKTAVALCQLPILGALGSKLRAKYIDGEVHSPSFLVSLEAPQASGKSFMRKLANIELAQMIEHDEEEREKEREYENKVKEMKLLNIKVTAENKDEVLGSRPETLIRFVPATMSVTKLLIRMYAAKGLHLFALAEEIDTVTKTFKRGFSSYSDLLRVGFDNGIYGQDYASENTFSGNVQIYYNMLTSGTPKAMRRFYPDVEDGLVSRVLFVTLPDQFGKKMPVWKEMDAKQKSAVDIGLVRLNEISIQGDEVQKDHFVKLGWLGDALGEWILQQQQEAVRTEDRTRDIFCRRSAVVGFRAGMLAFFLYNEKNTPTIRKNVVKFSLWVANCMLSQHLLRFNVTGTGSNVNQFEDIYNALDDVFTRAQVEAELKRADKKTPAKAVLSKWRLLGIIEDTAKEANESGHITSTQFKKIKK